MKVSNYPKVIVSQPVESLPEHLKEVLTAKIGLTETRKTRTSSDVSHHSERMNIKQADEAYSLFASNEDNSLRQT